MPVLFRCARGHDWEDLFDSTSGSTGATACPVCGSGSQLRSSAEQLVETLVPSRAEPPRQTAAPAGEGTQLRTPAVFQMPVSQTEGTLVRDPSEATPPPVMPSSMLSSGSGSWPTIPGYEIESELGRGGMGVVYKAKQVALGRTVALKMILSGSQAGASELARFRTEARALARLQHPNIVQIFEVGEHAESGNVRPYVSLEFVDGGSLADHLKKPLTMADSARLLETLARAVHFAHAQGVIHRDLKPANVMLSVGQAFQPDSSAGEDVSGRVRLESLTYAPKITDFGLARTLDSEAEQKTHSGQVLGTPAYMAPEQATGRGPVGPFTDVYSLGVMLFQFVTGRLPFIAESAMDMMIKLTTEEPPRPSRFVPKLARDLETIILKCLEKDPRRRYATALDLAEDLRRFQAHEPILARPVATSERLVRWVRRRPATTALLALACVSLLGLLVTLTVAGHTRRQRIAQARTEVQDALAGARAAADNRKWDEARGRLTAAEALVRGEAGLSDLAEEMERLKGDVEGHRSACQAVVAFGQARDEALFLATLATDPSAAEQTRRRVRDALALGGSPDGPCCRAEAYLDEQHKAEILQGRYELLLVLADLTEQGRPGRSPEEARAAATAALAVLDEAAALGLRTHAFHLRKARCLEAAGDAAGATEQRAEAAKRPPSTELDHYLAGSEYYRRGDLESASASFAESLRKRPKQFWPLYFLALCHVRQGELKAARDDLTSCLGQQKVVWIYLLRGFVEGQLGRYAHADADFREALALVEAQAGPGARYVLYNNRAVTSLGLRQYAAAEEDLLRAIELEPGQYQAHVTLSQVYLSQKKQAEAKASLDRAITAAARQHGRKELDSETMALLYRSRYRLSLEQTDREGALADLQAIIDLDGIEPAVKARSARERGHLFYRNGRLAEAQAAYEQSIRLLPAEAEPRRWRAEVLLRLKRYAEAADGFDSYLAGGGKPNLSVYRGRALARLQLGQTQKALEDFSLALGLAPNDASLREQRGRTYLACSAYQLAAADFDEALKRDATSLPSLQGRALARLQLGQPREATADAERAAELARDDGRVLYAAACVLVQAAEQVGKDARTLREQYQERAVALLRRTMDLMPQEQRSAYWRETVRRDPAIRPLRTHEGYVQLDRRLGRQS